MSKERNENNPVGLDMTGYTWDPTLGPRDDRLAWRQDPQPAMPACPDPVAEFDAECGLTRAPSPVATGYDWETDPLGFRKAKDPFTPERVEARHAAYAAFLDQDPEGFDMTGMRYVPERGPRNDALSWETDPTCVKGDPDYRAPSPAFHAEKPVDGMIRDRENRRKETNPKDAVGVRKVSFSCLPWRVLLKVAVAMMEGALKYSRHNYRVAGVRASVYFDAVMSRHMTAWWEGEDIDAPSGLHHIDKAIASLMVLRDSILSGNWVDDRPPMTADIRAEIAEANEQAAALIDEYGHLNKKAFVKGDEL